MMMKRKLLFVLPALMGFLLSAQVASADKLVLGTVHAQSQGAVIVPLNITGNTKAIGSVTVNIAYDDKLVSISPADITLAADTSAAGWKLQVVLAPNTPHSVNRVIQLNMYHVGARAISNGTINLADLSFNVLNSTKNIPLNITSFKVRDISDAEVDAYVSIDGSIGLTALNK